MEARTEIEVAKSWAVNGLSIEKIREYVKFFDCDNMKPFTDEQFIYIFRKEVIEPWFNSVKKNINLLIEKHSVFLNKNTTYLTKEDKFLIYQKEVLDKQPEVKTNFKKGNKATHSKYGMVSVNKVSNYGVHFTDSNGMFLVGHFKPTHHTQTPISEFHLLKSQPDLNDKLKEVIELYEVYLEFLNDANQEPIQLASIHGYKCPQYIIDKGKEYRDKIEQLTKPENQDKK